MRALQICLVTINVSHKIELVEKCHTNRWCHLHSSGWSSRNPRDKWWLTGPSLRRCYSSRGPFSTRGWAITRGRGWGGTNWWCWRRQDKSDTRGRWWWEECGFSRWYWPTSRRTRAGGTCGKSEDTHCLAVAHITTEGILNRVSTGMSFWSPDKIFSSVLGGLEYMKGI